MTSRNIVFAVFPGFQILDLTGPHARPGCSRGGGRVAHWSRCGGPAERYPEATVHADLIFVRDGEISTSAGVTAGMDLALAMVEDDHGPEVSGTIARRPVWTRWRATAASAPSRPCTAASNGP